jgi:sugar lactone lactonase YvrE
MPSWFFIGVVLLPSMLNVAADLYLQVVAGYGADGYAGDNGPATLAKLGRANGIWVDSGGNLYIPDADRFTIRKVNTNGIISKLGGGISSTTGTSGSLATRNFYQPYAIVGDTLASSFYLSDNRYVWQYIFSTDVMSVIAGTATTGFSGDNGPAISAQLNSPQGLWLTTAGVLYIADILNARIRRISAGIITTVAGTSSAGRSGDNGPATAAQLQFPRGLYMDTNGNLYIAAGGCIRKVNANGIIITLAGTGINGNPLDILPATAASIFPNDVKGDSLGNIYIADYITRVIRIINESSGIISPFIGNSLSSTGVSINLTPIPGNLISPTFSLWLDSQWNLYFAESGMIRRTVDMSFPPSLSPVIGPSSSETSTSQGFMFPVGGLSGGGTFGYTTDNVPATLSSLSANGLWVDSMTNIYFCQSETGKLKTISAVTGIITTLPGTGSNSCISLVGDTAGTALYVSSDDSIWKYSFSPAVPGENTEIIAGGGNGGDNEPAISAELYPAGIWMTSLGDIYVVDTYTCGIRKISNGIITTFAGGNLGCMFSGDGGPAFSSSMDPWAVVVDANNGMVFIAEQSTNRIRLVDTNNIITTFAGNGADRFNGNNIPATLAGLSSPHDVKLDIFGNVLIAEGNRIRLVNHAGIITAYIGGNLPSYSIHTVPLLSPIETPIALWVDSQNNVYFNEFGRCIRRTVYLATSFPSTQPIRSCSQNLFQQRIAGGYFAGYSGDNGPAALALIYVNRFWLDTNGNLYLPGKSRVRRVNSEGIIKTFGGNGVSNSLGKTGPILSTSFYDPTAITGDTFGSFLYITDQKYVWRYSFTTENVSVVAGIPPNQGFSGDNGPASLAKLDQPLGLWLTTTGILFIADSNNNRIREITVATGIITTFAGTSGLSGHGGDNGPATSARLSKPQAIFMDSVGKVFIADSSCIRLVGTNGIITTYGGNGGGFYNGDNIPATLASFSPVDVKGDSLGNIYIADRNNRIRMIDAAGIIGTIIGNGISLSTPVFSSAKSDSSIDTPQALWIDSFGSLYFNSNFKSIHYVVLLNPTSMPSDQPTSVPTNPSSQPTENPSSIPSTVPSVQPRSRPSSIPTLWSSSFPTGKPTDQPFSQPSVQPTSQPTVLPSTQPSFQPNSGPSLKPTSQPSLTPSRLPTALPYISPSLLPSVNPSGTPSMSPGSQPSLSPSSVPSGQPSQAQSNRPSSKPSVMPSTNPTSPPLAQPSSLPSSQPTCIPTSQPSNLPSSFPTTFPSSYPLSFPVNSPSCRPTLKPTLCPSSIPSLSSFRPSVKPNSLPSSIPSAQPSNRPNGKPSFPPTSLPTDQPTSQPTLRPTSRPSSQPSRHPSKQPLSRPSSQPTSSPISSCPTSMPTMVTESPTPLRNPSISAYPSQTRKPTKQPITLRPTRVPTVRPSFLPTPVPTQTISVFSSGNHHFKQSLFFFGSYLPAVEKIPSIDLTEKPIGSSYIIFGFRKEIIMKEKEIVIGTRKSQGLYSTVKNEAGLIQDQRMSRSAIPVGDINGDTYDDLLICDPMNSCCFVYYGNVYGFQNLQVSFAIKSHNNDLFGWSIAKLGDLNKDSYDDFAISAISSNAIFVVFGSNLHDADINIEHLNSSVGIKIIGSRFDQNSGVALSSAGDFNNDGYSDILYTALQLNPYQNVIYILFLSSKTINQDIIVNNLTPTMDYFKITAPPFSFAGFSLSNLGDINQDGFDDVIVGSFPYSGRYLTQKSYVIYGRNSSTVLLLSEIAADEGFIITGGGFMVTGPGDLNGDGIPDIMIVNYQQWQGKGNSYALVYPRNMTNPPSFLPSSQPSLSPSLSPTSRPSEAVHAPTNTPTFEETTNQPVSEDTFPPFLERTRLPSLPPKTSTPTRVPSIKLSTRFPTYKTNPPSIFPTRKPTVNPTKRPTNLPRTARPSGHHSHFPSSSPSTVPTESLTTPFAEIIIENQGIYHLPKGKTHCIIFGEGSFEITSNGGRTIYTILPSRNIITITVFNKKYSQISLGHFRYLHSIGDLVYSTNPLQIFLSSDQTLVLSAVDVTELTEDNFIFHTESENQNNNNAELSFSSMISLGILFSCVGLFRFLVKMNQMDEDDTYIWNDTLHDTKTIPVIVESEVQPESPNEKISAGSFSLRSSVSEVESQHSSSDNSRKKEKELSESDWNLFSSLESFFSSDNDSATTMEGKLESVLKVFNVFEPDEEQEELSFVFTESEDQQETCSIDIERNYSDKGEMDSFIKSRGEKRTVSVKL